MVRQSCWIRWDGLGFEGQPEQSWGAGVSGKVVFSDRPVFIHFHLLSTHVIRDIGEVT